MIYTHDVCMFAPFRNSQGSPREVLKATSQRTGPSAFASSTLPCERSSMSKTRRRVGAVSVGPQSLGENA